MTPKEKAEELVYRFAALLPEYGSMSIRKAKECALISVDEIIELSKHSDFGAYELYWKEVKKEIEKL